ncbi:MAG: STAS domain-containing protein [Acidobacteriota bacterium]
MEITRKRTGNFVDLELSGRLDGYWCDHLTAALNEVIHDGSHHLRVDCAQVNFLSSAGVGVLTKFYRELSRINGSFQVVNPSPRVSTVLKLTRLDSMLITPPGEAAKPATRAPARRIEAGGVGLEVFDLDGLARLTCRAIGSPAPLAAGAFREDQCCSFEPVAPALAVGVGAFGGSFADCQSRFGELISVTGVTAYQPGDGTNVADYLLVTGGDGSDIRLLYCLACDGRFSHLIRFDTTQYGTSVGLSRLISGCMDVIEANSVGVVIVAETSGLLGAALRHSPTTPPDDGGFFSHPGVRTRLTFTAERVFRGSLALVAGVVRRGAGLDRAGADQLRPIATDVLGHFHAAAFRFRPLRKGMIALNETVAGLFEPDQLLGVLHLLHDDRGAAGAGESEFVTGACWVAPIADDRAA